MASHGRRKASALTKQRKEYKRLRKQANLRMKKLNKTKFGGNKNPALNNFFHNGQKLPKAKDLSINMLRHNEAKARKFLSSETSTVKGSKRVLKQTLGNIFAGHGKASEGEIQAYNNFEVLIRNPDLGVHLIEKYFDIFYKVKDQLMSMHIGYISSDEILNAIKQEIETNKIIKNAKTDITTRDLSNETTEIVVKTYVEVMNSAEFINDVVTRLG